YLSDAWGMPLYFTRVPVGSAALNSNPYPGGGQPGINDPLDPQGYLQTGGWGTTYGTLFTTLTLQHLAGPSNSYNQAPMLLSSGQNKTLETDPVTYQTTTPGGDDLFSTP